MKNESKFWITVASKDHVQHGVKAGFMQANHGKLAPLKRISPGDWILFYSPKLTLEGDEKCQSFTAIGKVMDDEIYQFKISDDFIPYRRNVEFAKSKDVSIHPLIEKLDFLPNKKSWGFPFRTGFFEIGADDFNRIKKEMLSE